MSPGRNTWITNQILCLNFIFYLKSCFSFQTRTRCDPSVTSRRTEASRQTMNCFLGALCHWIKRRRTVSKPTYGRALLCKRRKQCKWKKEIVMEGDLGKTSKSYSAGVRRKNTPPSRRDAGSKGERRPIFPACECEWREMEWENEENSYWHVPPSFDRGTFREPNFDPPIPSDVTVVTSNHPFSLILSTC